MPLLTCQFTAIQHTLTHLYNLCQMVAILSNHEASLIYFPLIILPCRLKATLHIKDKEEWRIFIPAAITSSTKPKY